MSSMRKIFSLHALIIYSGGAAFLLMGISGVMGMRGADVELHANVAVVSFLFACVHAGLIVCQKIKIRATRKRLTPAA
jgi:hypothetical protein